MDESLGKMNYTSTRYAIEGNVWPLYASGSYAGPNLSSTASRVMFALMARAENARREAVERLSVTSLARRIGVSRQAASAAVNALEAHGIIHRPSNPSDWIGFRAWRAYEDAPELWSVADRVLYATWRRWITCGAHVHRFAAPKIVLDTGLSRQAVHAAIKQLLAAGIISRVAFDPTATAAERRRIEGLRRAESLDNQPALTGRA